MGKILALAQTAAEEAEVFTLSSEETQVHFEANRLKQLQTKQQASVALRIVKDGRIGYATSTRQDDAEELVRHAVETARLGITAKFRLPSLGSYPEIEVFDAAVEAVPIEQMINLGEEMISKITAHTPGIICDSSISKGVLSVSIINSRSQQVDYRKSFFSLGIDGNLTKGTDMLFVGEMASSCHPLPDTKAVTSAVLRQLELAKTQASVPSGLMPVVFTPNGITSSLIMPLMASCNGKTVLEGASPIGDKIGQKVFDEQLSLHDDPTITHQPGSRPFDDEGIPSQRTPIVEQGTITNFLYDLQTAALAGTRSTGNGSRNRGGLPSPSPSAFTITAGTITFEEMVRDIKQGLVIEQLMGAEQGNILGGDFSGNVLLGYKV
ncbi:TldD/PmbA family protein, partial [Chloroflexota bacterium]